MARRGFFAELQHQSRLAAQQRQRREREAYRAHAVAVRSAEQARKAADRAVTQAERASGAEKKRLDKEAREANVALREAEVLEKNERLAQIYDEIDSILSATLEVDDYVDLRSLRVVVTHPKFDKPDLEVPAPPPAVVNDPDEPRLQLPPPPSGLAALFGKRKHAEEVERAKRAHEAALSEWTTACAAAAERRREAIEASARQEAVRIEKLKVERERYVSECAAREAEAVEQNKRLLELIANLGYGAPDAVHEYISIVLANSVYPEHFPITHEFKFDPITAELSLKVTVPGPENVPSVKSYKYGKATDEISSSSLSQKECKDRYVGAICKVALRSFHEVFESDRRGLVRTIALEVGTDAVDRATGQRVYVPFVIASAERDAFLKFDLKAVVPALTLERMGAAVSKNPFALVPTERSGVRRT